MSTVGLAIIAKNEEKRLPNLLTSIEGAFDQIVLVDTGSIDRTKDVFSEWAAKQENLEWQVEYFHWTKDFSAARQHAQSFLTTDWESWADCDDIVVGAQNLRRVAEQAPENIVAYIAGYNYAQHPQTGACICYLKRERLVRRGKGKWMNRVHEAQLVDGQVQMVDRGVVEWIHQKQAKTVEELQEQDVGRNLEILENWIEDEPHNTRVIAYLGTENAAKGEIDEAIQWYESYLMHDPDWDEERAQIYRKLALCMLIKENPDRAITLAFEAVKLLPQWTDSYITLCEAYFAKQEHHKSVEWAQEALRRGEPETLLIINPLDYTYQPNKVMAGAYASLKQWDHAFEVGSKAWELNPMDEGLGQALQVWRGQAKLEHTANTIAMMAQQLIAHDEQLKAKMLLELCVPHFAYDHPGVVQLRSLLRERLRWVDHPEMLMEHYATGGSKPEDFLPDDKLDEVASMLPRTQFLYQGIHEQLLAQHHEGLIQEAEKEIPAILEQAGLSGPPS